MSRYSITPPLLPHCFMVREGSECSLVENFIYTHLETLLGTSVILILLKINV